MGQLIADLGSEQANGIHHLHMNVGCWVVVQGKRWVIKSVVWDDDAQNGVIVLDDLAEQSSALQ